VQEPERLTERQRFSREEALERPPVGEPFSWEAEPPRLAVREPFSRAQESGWKAAPGPKLALAR
jgi:hypothetical protein